MNTEPSTASTPEPPAPYLRIVQMDVLRGFALLGIYWINIFIFALPARMDIFSTALNDASTLNSFIHNFGETFIEGTMRGLFSLLFGASALIFLSEARLAVSGLELVDRYYRRTLLLIAFGVIHAYLLLWPYDVLYAYGVLGLFLFPLRKLSARVLLTFGVALLVIGDLALVDVQWTDKTDPPPESMAAQVETPAIDDPVTIADTTPAPGEVSGLAGKLPPPADQAEAQEQAETIEEIQVYRSGYTTIYRYQKDLVVSQQSSTFYSDYFYDIGGMMLVGMALFKLGVLSGQLARRAYLWLAIGGFLLGALTRGAFAYSDMEPVYQFSEFMLKLGGGYNLGRLCMTLGYVGLIGLLCSSNVFNHLARTLAAVGRMALTNYIMQTVLSLFLFYGIGLALFARLQRYELLLVCVSVWLFQILFSLTWLHWFKQGPLEWLWRSLIYGAMQPNRKNRGQTEPPPV